MATLRMIRFNYWEVGDNAGSNQGNVSFAGSILAPALRTEEPSRQPAPAMDDDLPF